MVVDIFFCGKVAVASKDIFNYEAPKNVKMANVDFKSQAALFQQDELTHTITND